MPRKIIFVIVLSIILSACAPAPATQTSEVLETSEVSPATTIPEATATSTPSPTPEPTATFTPTVETGIVMTPEKWNEFLDIYATGWFDGVEYNMSESLKNKAELCRWKNWQVYQ